jgi:hypothetical protein
MPMRVVKQVAIGIWRRPYETKNDAADHPNCSRVTTPSAIRVGAASPRLERSM